MRVFLSWSGNQSHQVALVLKEWLPTVIQALDTWVSSADIEKGEAWFAAITDSLVKSEGVGVFCLTADNLKAPWLAYEAGAIASHDRGRVATFLHKVSASDVKAPLGLFQATKSESKTDVLLLLTSLNARLKSPLTEQRLQRAFESNWPTLESQLNAIDRASEEKEPSADTDIPSMLSEILNAVKRIEKAGFERPAFIQAVGRGEREAGRRNLHDEFASGLMAGLRVSGDQLELKAPEVTNQTLAALLREKGLMGLKPPSSTGLLSPQEREVGDPDR